MVKKYTNSAAESLCLQQIFIYIAWKCMDHVHCGSAPWPVRLPTHHNAVGWANVVWHRGPDDASETVTPSLSRLLADGIELDNFVLSSTTRPPDQHCKQEGTPFNERRPRDGGRISCKWDAGMATKRHTLSAVDMKRGWGISGTTLIVECRLRNTQMEELSLRTLHETHSLSPPPPITTLRNAVRATRNKAACLRMPCS